MKYHAPSSAVPDPTPFLFLSGALLAWALMAGPSGPAGFVAVAAAGAPFLVGAIYLLSIPAVAVGSLVVAAAMPRLFLEISGLKARPEHLMVGMVCLALPFLLRRRHEPIHWMVLDYLLIAYVALNFYSSWFTSVDPSQTIRWCIQQTIAILPYFFLRLMVNDESSLLRAFKIVLAVGVAESLYAIVAFYSTLMFRTTFGVQEGQYDAVPGTYGTQFEANILGSYCGACAVMMLAMYLYERKGRYLLGYAVTLGAAAISLSRGALGATAIAFLVLFFYGLKAHLISRRVVLRVGIVTLCVVLILAPSIISLYSQRLSGVSFTDVGTDDNLLTRLIQIGLALENWLNSPVFGNGTSSFQLAFNWSDVDFSNDAGWIANTEVRVLHDTGIVGLTVFLSFLVLLLVQAKRTFKRSHNPGLLAMLIAGVVYCVSFQLTEGTLLAFSWVHLGLIACAISIYGSSRRKLEALWN